METSLQWIRFQLELFLMAWCWFLYYYYYYYYYYYFVLQFLCCIRFLVMSCVGFGIGACCLTLHVADHFSFFFWISKKRILLKKEKQEKHKELTVVNNGKRNNNAKQPLIYSNRRNKIRKGRTIWETPTTRPIKEGPLTKL